MIQQLKKALSVLNDLYKSNADRAKLDELVKLLSQTITTASSWNIPEFMNK